MTIGGSSKQSVINSIGTVGKKDPDHIKMTISGSKGNGVIIFGIGADIGAPIQ